LIRICLLFLSMLAPWAHAASLEPSVVLNSDSLVVRFKTSMSTLTAPAALHISPALKNSCRWDDDTTLACSFGEKQPQSATAYQIDVPSLAAQNGDATSPHRVQIDFQRPNVRSYGTWNDGRFEVRLFSHQSLNKSDVLAVLSATVDGQPIKLELLPEVQRSIHEVSDISSGFAVVWPALSGTHQKIELSIRPGLRSPHGKLLGEQSEVLQRWIYKPRPRLHSLSCGGTRDLDESASDLDAVCAPLMPITLQFSHSLSDAQLAAFRKRLRTPWEFVAHAHHNYGTLSSRDDWQQPGGTTISIRSPRANAKLQLDLDAELGLPAHSKPFRLELRTDQFTPVWYAQHSRLLLANPSMPWIYTAELERLQGYRFSIGKETHHGLIDINAGASSQLKALALPNVSRALKQGGYAMAWPQQNAKSSPLKFGLQTAEVSAPQMDVRTFIGQGSILVWVNDWNDANKSNHTVGVNGASVAVKLWTQYDSAPILLRTARTDGKGAALIPLENLPKPDAHARDGFPKLIVEATHSNKRAVLVRSLPMQDPVLKLWGFSDKPLYRAGEEVRFQLYAREWKNGRIDFAKAQARPAVAQAREQTRELALVKQWSDYGDAKELMRFNLKASQSGALNGKITLPAHARDGDYCIVAADAIEESNWDLGAGNGACFYVGTFRPRDVYVNISTPKTVLNPKDKFQLEFDVGLFSGNAASGLEISQIESDLSSANVRDAFPEYSAYSFLTDDDDYEANSLNPESDGIVRTDANGRASLSLRLPKKLPAFGRVQANAAASLKGREPTAGNTVSAYVARDERYLGLRRVADQSKLGAPTFDVLEIDRAGRKLPSRALTLEIFYTAPDSTTEKSIERCAVQSNQIASCEFNQISGSYRFVLSGESAANAELQWQEWADIQGVEPEVRLSLESLTQRSDGRVAAIQIQSTLGAADALIYASQGGSVLSHRVYSLPASGASELIDIPVPLAWQGNVQLTAVVRRRVGSSIKNGLREVTPVASEALTLALPRQTYQDPLQLSFDAAQVLKQRSGSTEQVRPGAQIKLRIRNVSEHPQSVTVAVQDDGMRALAIDVLAGNPLSFFIGNLFKADAWINEVGFDDFNRDTWQWYVEGSANSSSGYFDSAQLDEISVTGSRIMRADVLDVSSDSQTKMQGKPSRNRERSLAAILNVRSYFPDVALWESGIVLAANEERELVFKAPDNLTQWRAIAVSENLRDAMQLAQQEATINVGQTLSARMQLPARLFVGDQSELMVNLQQSGSSAMRVKSDVIIKDGQSAVVRGIPGFETVHSQKQSVAALGEALVRVPFDANAAGTFSVQTNVVDCGDACAPGAKRDGSSLGPSDAVLGQFLVRERTIPSIRTQSAWFGADPLKINFPPLPTSASNARLTVRAQRGLLGIESQWIENLRDFPHRCWEQMLSRAVAASVNEKRQLSDWRDQTSAIDEVINNAGVFQTSDGGFNFFPSSPRASPELTAYTVRVFDYLREQGYPVPAAAHMRAEQFLQRQAEEANSEWNYSENAYALAYANDSKLLKDVWVARGMLSFSGKLALAHHLGEKNDARLNEFWTELLADAPLVGNYRRVVFPEVDYDFFSENAAQCGLVKLAKRFADRIPAEHARELQAGLRDLYAGGDIRTDTHAAAQCLLALSADTPQASNQNSTITLNYGTAIEQLRLNTDRAKAEVMLDYRAQQTLQLRNESDQASGEPVHYQAELSYQEDAATAQANAIGLSLERRFWLLKNEAWQAVSANTRVNVGDWVRVELIVRTTQTRHHVALTDTVAGGYVPTDLELSSTATLTLKKLSDTGSYAFRERQLDAQTPRFYAELLPSGEHRVYYFVRASNAGRYLAPPATAELMYSPSSRARTASDQVRIAR
jgi:hypothetical protein